jgi:hypothetical protein
MLCGYSLGTEGIVLLSMACALAMATFLLCLGYYVIEKKKQRRHINSRAVQPQVNKSKYTVHSSSLYIRK